MRWNFGCRGCVLLVLLNCGVCAAEDLERFSFASQRMIEAIRPRAGDEKWKRIPWLVDLDEAIDCARMEKRPLFLWVAGDDPLDRC